MTFKDRSDAGNQLAIALKKDADIRNNIGQVTIVSLLRGGIIVGNVIAEKLGVDHLPLVVTKIPAPYNPELAIGALCFDAVYLNQDIVGTLFLDKPTIEGQIDIAREKFDSYLNRFNLDENYYLNKFDGKITIVVDDGIATGSTAQVARLFLLQQKAEKVFLAAPVAPDDFDSNGFDGAFILDKDPYFGAVSQYYESFPPVTDEEVKNIIIKTK